MNVLLLSQVPAEFEGKRLEKEYFPKFQAQTFWLKGLRALGHTVMVVRYSDPIFWSPKTQAQIDLGIKKMSNRVFNRSRLWFNKHYRYNPQVILRSMQICRAIKTLKPEKTIFSGGISHLNESVLDTLQSVGSTIYLLHGEDPIESATTFERNTVRKFDWIITNDPQHAKNWTQLGAKNAIGLPYAGIDPTIHKRIKLTKQEEKQFSTDVVFVGSLFPERQLQLTKLLKLPIALKIYGYVPPTGLLPQLNKVYAGEAWGETLVKAINGAKIALNFVPPHMPIGGNMRTFEIAGSGTFQLIERCPTDWYTPDKEIVLFSNIQDLQEKIDYFLKHDSQRHKIAQNAYNKTHAHYTYKERFKHILSLV